MKTFDLWMTENDLWTLSILIAVGMDVLEDPRSFDV